ncbi:MFS transporter [Sphingomonas lacunae]|uniref:MFS transporter n=1 Tax=Sphingomonas lacunae TaxID=2698828 RepID=A0A6M4AYG6_9SPHN|nr:MFS transporter [Sphingomonas lacunae]QJQ32051.1 MFS transporter [Sphingomonas lacunae]
MTVTGETLVAAVKPQGRGQGHRLAYVGYGVGQIAGQVFRDVPSLLLLFFLSTVVGIDVGIAGAAIFVPKFVFGIGSDMVVGILSDRWKARIARRWWLLIGAVLAPLAMILLFHVPEGSDALRISYVVVAFSLYMGVFASFSVPYLAMAGEMASTSTDRTLLMAWRLVFTAIGVLVAGALAPTLVERFGGGQEGYESMAIVLAVLCPISLLIAFFSTARMSEAPVAETLNVRIAGMTVRQVAAVLWRPRFRTLFTANLLQLIGSGMGYAALMYFLSYNMGRTDALTVVGLIVLAACAGIIVAQPMWVWVAGRFGKVQGYVAGSIIYSLSYLVWMVSADAGVGFAVFLSFAAAIGNSGWAMTSFSMLADISGEDESNAGLYSAAWVAADKIAFALGGTLLIGLTLSAFGFDTQAAMSGAPQSETALLGVAIAFGLIPPLLNLSGALLLGLWSRRNPA